MDTSLIEQYMLDGRKNPVTDKVNFCSSFCHISANCNGFEDKETALQCLGTQFGVTVMFSPKLHDELAGKGDAYYWAHSKSFYQRLPLA